MTDRSPYDQSFHRCDELTGVPVLSSISGVRNLIFFLLRLSCQRSELPHVASNHW